MELTSKQQFIGFLEEASQQDKGYVGVIIKLPGQDKPELIVNHAESMGNKLQYLSITYNEDLTLIANPEVRILGYKYCLDFEELKSFTEVVFEDEQ